MPRIIESQIQKDCIVIIMGCMHSGAANCYWSGIHKLVKRVKDEEVYGVLNTGDNIEGKIPGSKHYTKASIDLKNLIITPQEQAEAVVKVLSPIKHKILAWGRGNHEGSLENTWDAGRYIAEKLEVPYGLFAYVFDAKNERGKTQFKFYIHHGRGMLTSNAKDAVQRKANKEATLRQRFFGMGVSDCILYAGSHWHQQIISPPSYTLEKHIGTKNGKITQHYRDPTPQNSDYISPDQRWVASVGCFRKVFTDPDLEIVDYAERGMYSGAADLGWVEVEVKDYRVHDVKAITV